MGLPIKLTSEEQSLLDKYSLLKKRRKELQLKLTSATANNNENQKVVQGAKKGSQDLPPRAPSDAKELAKRKILSGELKIKRDSSNREFKRARSSSEKKPKDLLDIKESTKHEPHGLSTFKTGGNEIGQRQTNRSSSKGLYDNFVSGGTANDSSPNNDFSERTKFGDRRKGKVTIFVSGYELTNEILQSVFTRFGTVTNIHLEAQRGNGFVTFASHESADKAITEMNGEMVHGITLRVAMARRQPYDNTSWASSNSFDRNDTDRSSHRNDIDRNTFPDRNPFPDRSRDRVAYGNSTEVTSEMPAKPTKNGKDKSDRDLISYEEEFDF